MHHRPNLKTRSQNDEVSQAEGPYVKIFFLMKQRGNVHKMGTSLSGLSDNQMTAKVSNVKSAAHHAH